jgi:hypothetical protein
LLRYRGAAMAEFWRALRTLKALQAEQAAALETPAGEAASAERTALPPPVRIAPRWTARHPAPGPNPNEPGPEARPDEPEPAAGRGLAYLRSEPGAGRALHEPAVTWLPKEPAPASLEDAAPHPNAARPEGERKRRDRSA